MSLEDRVAVVTGGTGALGRAVTARLLELGASVHVPWVVDAEEAELRGQLEGDEGLHLHRADLTREADVAALFSDVAETSGRLDMLCNIAGGFVFAALEDTAAEQWHRMLDMNATTAFLACRAAAPLLERSGGGRIVNVTAMPALERGAAMMSAYAASKAAVLNLTQSLASELAPKRVTVNAIAPSIIDTPANREAMPDEDHASWLAPAEIAAVVEFLCSESAAIVTGSVLALSRHG